MTETTMSLHFIQSVSDESYDLLAEEAKKRGITIQLLIRAAIIPEWTRAKIDGKTAAVKKASEPKLKLAEMIASQAKPVNSHRKEKPKSLYFREVNR